MTIIVYFLENYEKHLSEGPIYGIYKKMANFNISTTLLENRFFQILCPVNNAKVLFFNF